MNIKKQYTDASVKTADNLKSIAQSMLFRDVSQLSLPEIDAVVDLVAKVIPAGNVPGVILSGLARLTGRKPPPKTISRDINLLFKGIEQALDRAVYTAFFAGPAAVIWGYQNLLKLAGKDPNDSFPEGTWQFYVNYALREDTARHANETHGFDSTLRHHQVALDQVDRITSWVMAAIQCLHQYDELLKNEWRERVYAALLRELTSGTPVADDYARIYQEWEARRPYARGLDADPSDTYPAYRQQVFERFLNDRMRELPADLRRAWAERVRQAKDEQLPAYQRQMSILAYLDPGAYGETNAPIGIEQAHVAVIHQDHYYLIPACAPGSSEPSDVATVRAQIAALIRYPSQKPTAPLAPLARVKRSALVTLRPRLDPGFAKELEALRYAPIVLNCDPIPPSQPLVLARQAERGIGDHALTIFDTGGSFVFDQSHIFFDGAWGAALAEILTNEATSWAIYLRSLPAAQSGEIRPYAPALRWSADDWELVHAAPRVSAECGAETDALNVKAIQGLRKMFKQRNDLLQLTVNDLLVLYRALHAATYQPAPALLDELQGLMTGPETRPLATAALEAIEASRANPAVLIPVDASLRDPRDRLHPMNFEVPLHELDILPLHAEVMALLDQYEQATGDRSAAYAQFDQLQRRYLATLAGFGAVLSKAKEIALTGESATSGAIKLLAHMPQALQRLLDNIPGRFDVLNDIIKGREVFSNVGVVAPSSTLTRFITAKDDNDKKTLAWGVITDAQGVMRVTLRDFRPHVALFEAAGRMDVAMRITGDYLESYAHGMNRFIRDLHRITSGSRETRLSAGGRLGEPA